MVVTTGFSHGSAFSISSSNKVGIVSDTRGLSNTNLVFDQIQDFKYHPPTLDPVSDTELLKTFYNKAIQGLLTQKGPADCMEAYRSSLQNRYRNILVVSEAVKNDTNSILWLDWSSPLDDYPTAWTYRHTSDGSYPANGYILSNNTSGALGRNSSNWAVGYYGLVFNGAFWSLWSYLVSYCLVEDAPHYICSLNYDLWLFVVVIIANAVKVAAMTITLTKLNASHLVTLGEFRGWYRRRRLRSSRATRLFLLV